MSFLWTRGRVNVRMAVSENVLRGIGLAMSTYCVVVRFAVRYISPGLVGLSVYELESSVAPYALLVLEKERTVK